MKPKGQQDLRRWKKWKDSGALGDIKKAEARGVFPVVPESTVTQKAPELICVVILATDRLNPNAVSEKYAKEVCRFGEGTATCAFLTIANDGLECVKGTNAEQAIRERLAEGPTIARGDHCEGIANSPCRALCYNSDVCFACNKADLASCKFDPNVTDKSDCRPRCINPDGVCPDGQTLYEKLGYKFE